MTPPEAENFITFLDVSENDPAGGGKFLAISTDLQSGMLSGNSESHLRSQKKSRAYRRERIPPPPTPDFPLKYLRNSKKSLKNLGFQKGVPPPILTGDNSSRVDRQIFTDLRCLSPMRKSLRVKFQAFDRTGSFLRCL